MITPVDILKSINSLLKAAVPEFKRIHYKYSEKYNERPCLLIEHVTTQVRDSTKRHVAVVDHFSMTMYGAMDEHRHSDPLELLELQTKIMKAFRSGKLMVWDTDLDEPRFLNVTTSTGGTYLDRAFVNLALGYSDVRGHELAEYEIMEDVDLEVVVETHEGGL